MGFLLNVSACGGDAYVGLAYCGWVSTVCVVGSCGVGILAILLFFFSR